MLSKRAILIALGIVVAIAATVVIKEFLRKGPTTCKPTAGSFSSSIPAEWEVSTTSGKVTGSVTIPKLSTGYAITLTNVSGAPQTITGMTLYISVDNQVRRVDEFPAGCSPFFGIKSSDCVGVTLQDRGGCTTLFGSSSQVSSGKLEIDTSAGQVVIVLIVM